MTSKSAHQTRNRLLGENVARTSLSLVDRLGSLPGSRMRDRMAPEEFTGLISTQRRPKLIPILLLLIMVRETIAFNSSTSASSSEMLISVAHYTMEVAQGTLLPQHLYASHTLFLSHSAGPHAVHRSSLDRRLAGLWCYFHRLFP